MKQRIRQLLAYWFFIAMLLNPVLLQANNLLAKEYFLKAAFLYNFARLVEWPSIIFRTDTDPIRLCFMGDDPFGDSLKTIQNKKVAGRPLIIQRDITVDQAFRCQILFISQSEKNKLPKIAKTLTHYPVLTVSELSDFAHEYGHIRFVLAKDKKLTLEVNLDAIKRADLQISSRVLMLAKIVHSEEAIKP